MTGGVKKGEYSQRELLLILKDLIASASAKGASAHRDLARAELRRVMETSNWNTEYIIYNLAAKRCRYLRSLGYPIAWSRLYAKPGDLERLEAAKDRER